MPLMKRFIGVLNFLGNYGSRNEEVSEKIHWLYQNKTFDCLSIDLTYITIYHLRFKARIILQKPNKYLVEVVSLSVTYPPLNS